MHEVTMSAPNTPSPQPDPLLHTFLHQLLVNSNRLQSVPPLVIAALMMVNAGLLALSWGGRGTDSVWVIGCYSIAMVINWLILYRLRATGRSYGPERPSVIALIIVAAGGLSILGLIGIAWWVCALILIAGTLIVFYATWIEPFQMDVTQQHYETSKWKRTEKPLRLLQIGDIHVERITPRERHLNEVIRALEPDIIVFTGDYVNLSNTDDPSSEQDIRSILQEWQAPLGVYCISGTPLVEPLERVIAFTRDLPHIKLLPNQWITLPTPGGALNILGLVVSHDMTRDRNRFQQMMLSAPQTGLHLLLMHPPDIAPEANEAGIDLYLCGHTHGGQIRLPLIGAVFSSSHLGKRFVMGRYELGKTTLYTARGVGLEGLGAPRARFLCPPEIVLWDIHGTG
jgi:uncharacterized protein